VVDGRSWLKGRDAVDSIATVSGRFTALEDETNIIKGEVKQVLIRAAIQAIAVCALSPAKRLSVQRIRPDDPA
jgi:hypothetical protein